MIMKYFFTKEELNQIYRKKGLQRTVDFFKTWTQKEAIAKMFGNGISNFIQKGDNSNYIVLRIIPNSKYIGALSYEK